LQAGKLCMLPKNSLLDSEALCTAELLFVRSSVIEPYQLTGILLKVWTTLTQRLGQIGAV